MKANVIGNSHNSNQDFLITGKNFGIIADGCSSCKYSEVGTRLVLQFFEFLEDKENEENFEKNIKGVIEDVLEILFKYEKKKKIKNFANTFVSNNFLFTLLACFEKKDEFVVYVLGDGYIITQNMSNEFSYIHMDYDNHPPYILYNYCTTGNKPIYNIPFKRFVFSKEFFKGVGIASDGIEPIVNGVGNISQKGKKQFEEFLSYCDLPDERKDLRLKNFIAKLHRKEIYDDASILFLGGK